MESKGRILVVDDEVERAHRSARAAARRGLRGRDRGGRVQGARQAGRLRAGPGPHRPQDAGDGRHPAARPGAGSGSGAADHRHDRVRRGRDGGGGDARRGARTTCRSRSTSSELSIVIARELAARRIRDRGGGAAGAAVGEVQLREHHRQLGADAGGVQDRRPDRVVARQRAHHRRVGDRQGADRGRDSRAQPAGGRAVRQASLRGARGVAARERAVRARARMRSPARSGVATAASSRPTTGRCSSTRSARSRRRSR